MNTYRVEMGKIISPDKIPHPPRWLADNRLAFQVNEQGLGDIDYFNADSHGHHKAFAKSFWGGMRFYVNDGTHNYLLSFAECEILPFCITGRCYAGDTSYTLSIYAANDTVFIALKTGGYVPAQTSFRLEFYQAYCMLPQGTDGDLRYKSHIKRQWADFTCEDNRLLGGFTEEGSTTGICIGTGFDMSYQMTKGNKKHMISSLPLCENSDYVTAVAFDTSFKKALARCDASIQSYKSVLAAQYERYHTVARKAPVLSSPYEELNRFFALSPLYHESLKVTDVAGAIRAQTAHYWVWGWDSMTSNEAAMYWGDNTFISDMLSCLHTYADDQGVAHAFNRDMTCGDAAPPPAQGMYITLLYLHHTSGGGIDEFYPFAKKLFKRILDSEVDDLGLCKGTSLAPDFRGLLRETGHDISAFNNTVSYCAIRCMEALAFAMGDTETEKTAREFGQRLRTHFPEIVFNKELGFVDSSADSITLTPRGVPSNNAVKWENNFCGELLNGLTKECMEFYKKHLISPAGLRPIPTWCEVYDGDANQLSCWWPVMAEFYARLINTYDQTELVEQLVGWIRYWTEKLMCPEGISCYTDTDTPPLDNWNCLNGIWHAYSIRGLYNAAVHAVVGVDLDAGGLTVYPYSGKELQLTGLHWGDMLFDVQMQGSGPFVKSIEVNGKTVKGTHKIPLDMLTKENRVVVNRQATPDGFCYIKKAYGIRIAKYVCSDDSLSATLAGACGGECTIYAAGSVTIHLNGQRIDAVPDEGSLYRIPLDFGASKQPVTILCRKGADT